MRFFPRQRLVFRLCENARRVQKLEVAETLCAEYFAKRSAKKNGTDPSRVEQVDRLLNHQPYPIFYSDHQGGRYLFFSYSSNDFGAMPYWSLKRRLKWERSLKPN